ncbi:MAG: FAD-dependent thymidylate synthase [Parcubacteria group bacterium]|nr:FAD-dependent thymidylate synthase [Parcubacteria group bacterium]
MDRESRELFAPEFPPEEWSPRDRFLLEPFATNMDGFVSVLHNLPPEIVGALCSRASRAAKSLLRVLLEEYIYPIVNGENKELARELETIIQFFHKHGFRNILNNQRAQSFYVKWLSQYGDDSIAQMTGTHVVFWGISQVALKFLEDRRIGLEPIEKSTRYVNFGNKVGGNYLYYTPRPDLESIGLLSEYRETLNHLFETYADLQPKLFEWLKRNFEEKDAVLEKKSFDTLRGLLPMATLSQVAFRGNAQAFEYSINRLTQYPLGEFRWIASALKAELDKEIPSLLLRISDPKSEEYQRYLVAARTNVRDFIEKNKTRALFARDPVPVLKPEVRLVEYDLDSEKKIVAAILFPLLHKSWDETMEVAGNLSSEEKEGIFSFYPKYRTARWYKVGRAFENSYLRFEIVMNAGAYRDLQRHRMMTQERQLFSTRHGYDVPREIDEAGMKDSFCEALERARVLFGKIEARDPELAQYVVPLAYRVRFYQWQNFRQFFWESELRTISQGHPDYRFIEQEKYRLAQEKFPSLTKHFLVDMNQYSFARRGTEEGMKEKEERLVRKLREKHRVG